MMSKNKKRRARLLLAGMSIVLGFVIGIVLFLCVVLFVPNVKKKGGILYIHSGATKKEVVQTLAKSGLIKNMWVLQQAMELLRYEKVYAGRFEFMRGMSSKQIVRILASNMQSVVNLRIPSVQTKERMAEIIAQQIELDAKMLVAAMNDSAFAATYGFSADNFLWMFLPNTYQVYWNMSMGDFFDRMYNEWHNFWEDGNRKEKLKELKMSRMEVITLASIVNAETNKVDEMPDIAGVYINRLRSKMRLQADPTVRYAMNAKVVHRIRNVLIKHKYNTYLVDGLPPGPINVPSPQHIDAVLNYRKHNYVYFCARDDFSGYHNFSKTYTQHLVNAKKYQSALNQRKIFQ